MQSGSGSSKIKKAIRLEQTTMYKSELTGKEITFTVSEKLNTVKGKALAPKKLADANKLLRKLKTPLPK